MGESNAARHAWALNSGKLDPDSRYQSRPAIARMRGAGPKNYFVPLLHAPTGENKRECYTLHALGDHTAPSIGSISYQGTQGWLATSATTGNAWTFLSKTDAYVYLRQQFYGAGKLQPQTKED
jgi:hypothetical protein